MEKRIITISREFGSGGRTIGKLVAEHLGIQCYDAELIQKLAAESGFDESYVKEAGEYTPGGFLASAFTDRSFGPTNEDLLWKLQYRSIRELAEKEPCVIVGRCADFILQDRTDCLVIFFSCGHNKNVSSLKDLCYFCEQFGILLNVFTSFYNKRHVNGISNLFDCLNEFFYRFVQTVRVSACQTKAEEICTFHSCCFFCNLAHGSCTFIVCFYAFRFSFHTKVCDFNADLRSVFDFTIESIEW